MNAIFGTGGCAREVDWLLHDFHAAGLGDYRPEFFVTEDGGDLVGSQLKGRPVVGESDFIQGQAGTAVNCFVAVGLPGLRAKIAAKLQVISTFRFPAIVHPTVIMDRRPGAVVIGEGSLLCAGSVLMTDITVGRFTHVNLDCTIGHDAVISDFCTLSPGVHVSGKVRLGHGVYVGAGAVLIENLDVVDGIVIGAGAVVRESLRQAGTYVGVPAKRLQSQK